MFIFGVVRLTINAIKRKFLYYDYQIAFDGAGFEAIIRLNVIYIILFYFKCHLNKSAFCVTSIFVLKVTS